jgi:hypothetical protein
MPELEHSTAILASAASRWRDRCLVGQGSVFTNEPLWTLDHVAELVEHFAENIDLSEGSFFTKLKGQLNPTSPGAKKLAAEMLWVMYLIVHESSMHAATKRLQVEKVWGWSGASVPDDPFLLDEALSAGVAHPGMAFHTHRWRELLFFIRLVERWKRLPHDRQDEVLRDGWSLGSWLDDQEESKGRQLRHILLFLLFPYDFEPIVTGHHKRAIVKRWYNEAGGSLQDLRMSDHLAVDRALAQVRQHLQSESPSQRVHFYLEPWSSEWRDRKKVGGDGQGTTGLVEQAAADAWYRNRFGDARVWVMAAGDGARLWPEFQRDSVVAMGLDPLEDLSEHGSKEDLHKAISEARGVDNPVNDTLAGWQFVHEMQPGDHIIAKEGRSKLLGLGVVKSDYRYDSSRSEYRNLRDVKWLRTGRWNLPEEHGVPLKTLTDVTASTRWVHMAIHLMEGQGPGQIGPDAEGFSLERAVKGLFMAPEQFSDIVDLLGRKMNVILQGPPGTGKTYIARRVAYRLMDEEDPSRVQMVQFHQAYAYEDFVQGYRPTDDGGFCVKNGVFYDFCRRAGAEADRKYVFIIDEINRGNLPRILGELMLLIEADKRDPRYAVPLTYAKAGDEPFYVPDNLYILGMMNTADRSLAMVDYALRRRFGFVTLRPEFQSEGFADHLVEVGVPREMVRKIEERMTRLNEHIATDQKNLGPGFEIGHSYFVPTEEDTSLDDDWYSRVIRTEVEPLLREYWFDQPKRVDEQVQHLLS